MYNYKSVLRLNLMYNNFKLKLSFTVVCFLLTTCMPLLALERITAPPNLNNIPGQTDESKNSDDSKKSGETDKNSGKDGSQDKPVKVKIKPVPYVASVVTCTVIGTPVAMFRHTIDEINQGQKDLVGKYNNIVLKTIATGISTPYGLLSGCLQAPFWGVRNSLKYSKDKPFSAEAMGLGKP